MGVVYPLRAGNFASRILLLLALPLAGPAAESPARQEPGAPAGDADLEAMTAELGSKDWKTRENAQTALLEAGIAAVPSLTRAARSGNPELAYRARYLLDRIDPEVIEFRIIKLRTDEQPHVLEVYEALGLEGRQLVARSVVDGNRRATFSLEYRDSPDGLVDVRIAKVLGGSRRVELRRPLQRVSAVSLLEVGEQCEYRRLGPGMERDREHHIIVLRMRRGRCSVLAADGSDLRSEEVLADLVQRLLRQGRDPELPIRLEALDILAGLRVKQAEGLFRAALDDPACRTTAALGLGEPELLLECLRESGTPPGSSVGGAVGILRPVDRAALRLLEGGNPAGIDILLEATERRGPFALHVLLASLADHADAPFLSGVPREQILDRVLSPSWLARMPWDNPECEYFYTRWADVLVSDSDRDLRRLLAFQSRLEKLLCGDLGSMRAPGRTCIDLWRRVTHRLPKPLRPSELAFLLRIISCTSDILAFQEIAPLLEDLVRRKAHAEKDLVAPDELKDLCETLSSRVESSHRSLAMRSHQCLLRLSQSLYPGEGRLRALVEALIRTGKAASTASSAAGGGRQGTSTLSPILLRQTRDELTRWTGIRGTGGGASGGTHFDPRPWQSWLENGSLVRAREESLGREVAARAAARGDSPADLVFYEFDLALRRRPRDVAGRSTGPASFQVLDGRRLLVSSGVSEQYADRWGNDLPVLLEREGTGTPRRYRLNGRYLLYTGCPVLTSIPEKGLSVESVAVSDVQPEPQQLTSTQGSIADFRSVLLVALAPEGAPAPGESDDPAALWNHFRDTYVLHLEPDDPRQRTTAVLNLVRSLKIEGTVPLLRRLFQAAPSTDIARYLSEAGDTGALEYLEGELESHRPERRLAAAAALCELGSAAGVRGLIAEFERNQSKMNSASYTILNSLAAFLRNADASDPGREAAMDFLFDRLSDAVFQSRAFSLIQQQTGQDFGYDEARMIRDLTRRSLAIQEAIRKARAYRDRSR